MKKTINIIGAGRLGQTVGHLCVKSGRCKIGGVCNQSLASTLAALAFIGEGTTSADIFSLPHADITLIASPDDCIEHAALALSNSHHIRKGDIIFHMSGALTSDALLALKSHKVYIASVHPMKSFAHPSHSFHGTYCAVEGDTAAIDALWPLFNAMGALFYTIEKEKKALYHASGVFAANYLVTLAQQAIDCLLQAGVEESIAPEVVLDLMQSTLDNLKKTKSPTKALTGPLERGDLRVIQSHLKELSSLPKALYQVLGQATLPLTEHPSTLKEEIKELINLEL